MNFFTHHKTAAATIIGIIVAFLIYFNFATILMWMTLNNPFQGQWATVQLSDGEILYGHLSGVTGTTIGLKDVYLLEKITPNTPTTSASGDFGLGNVAQAGNQPQFVAVSSADFLYINRTSVLYFKFVQPSDPALPYLK